MALRLSVSPLIDVPVRVAVAEAGSAKPVAHEFTLIADRASQQEVRDALEDRDVLTRDWLMGKVKGWKGQDLVLEEDAQPAAFGPEAFGLLLSLAGMEQAVLTAYLGALAVTDSSAARAKK